MNRIYKVIWSAVRNTYVAVAETTHAHGKAHSTKQQIFAALAAGVLVVGGMSSSAYAAEGKVLAGASNNVASGEDSSVSGGLGNKASEKYASVSGGAINTASGEDSSVSGGTSNTASGKGSSVSGGISNTASGEGSSVSGGRINTASGKYSSVSGGCQNIASGNDASISGGSNNTALGGWSSISGGDGNIAMGRVSSAHGGTKNIVMEQYATSLGGEKGVAQGYGSVIIGGSTGKDAIDAVAIGPSSVVTAIHGTAVGYQSTTNQSDTIAFGHDADDVSGYTVTWQQRTDTDSEGHIVKNADGTTNDYTKAPTVTENKYTSSYYNRLVKVADGQSAHDVATVGQTVELVAGDHVKVEADTTATNMIGQQRKKISILTNGKIEKGNTGLVTGDAINTALSAETTARQNADTTLNKQLTTTNKNVSDLQTAMKQKADTSLSNLTDAGRTAVKDIMKDDLSKKADVSTVYTKTEVDSQVSGLRTDLAGKADTNLSNLTDAGKTAVKDIMKDDLSKKADVSSVYTKTEVDSQVSGLKTDLAGKADASLSNLTDAGKTAVKDIMKDDLAQKADKSTVYTKAETYNRTEIDGKVSGLTTNIAGKADTSLSNLTDAGKTAVKDIMKDDMAQKVDKSAANLSADDVKNWQDKLGNGNIARGDHGLISGGKVFEALQGVGNYGLVKSDGKVVNIAKDDSAKVIDVSGAGTNRVITGVKTDVRDPSSAANVAYVNGNTQQIYQDMNQAYGSLRNDISRAAASSNALAALKPMEFDSDDKLQFGIGYGHYHNANAAAVGAFYQPDENCMMNLGASIGNGNPGVSAGITIKFGPGGSGAPMLSKRQMAKIIQNQSVQLDEQSKEIESLKQENQEMKEQLKAILDKLNK